MILSILIPSMYKRSGMLAGMLRNLDDQIKSLNADDFVEVRVNIDDGEKTTGEKRNELLKEAEGEYVVFVDDDDEVPSYYVNEILKALENKPDAIGINGTITTNGLNEKKWWISKDLNYCALVDDQGRECYHRFNNHLSPVRRDIAIQIGFPNWSQGEDYNYAVRLHDAMLIKTESIIDKPMYHYKFNPFKEIPKNV